MHFKSCLKIVACQKGLTGGLHQAQPGSGVSPGPPGAIWKNLIDKHGTKPPQYTQNRMIPLAQSKLDEAQQHALQEYPFECCGIIIGRPDSDQEDILFRCTNIQNKLHEMDPEKFVRDARTAYYIDPKELLGILKETESRKLAIKLFYHSHPEHDAYFSEEDARMALFDNEPTYPEARYLVISVYNKKIKEQAFFEWNLKSKTFEKQPE